MRILNLSPNLRSSHGTASRFSRALLKDGNSQSRLQPEAVLSPVAYRSSRGRRQRKRLLLKVPTDNAAYVVATVRHTGWIHVPCFAHTINLVVSEAIKADIKIHQLRKDCTSIVIFFHHSAKASGKLNEIELHLRIPTHKLVQEVGTRLHSTEYMFERITEKHQATTIATSLVAMLCDVSLLKGRQRTKRFLWTSMSPFRR